MFRSLNIGRRYSTRASDPLRILFCGSDRFSCESLWALHGEHVRNRRLVEALDVMVLPGKRMGRGLKEIRQVPCKSAAQHLDLKIHERDTFRGWNLPDGINLIVVVSFGLFVPPRILKAAKYGGVNVHPSLLPDLRGPAPIHRAMLRGDERMGVTLQTLHHESFDHGTVLAQTPPPGLPVPPSADIGDLTTALGRVGAQMLVQGLRDGLHVGPHQDAGWWDALGAKLDHAPKVTKADARIDWAAWDGDALGRRMRVFGMAWTRAVNDKGDVKRVLLQDAKPVGQDDAENAEEGRMTFEQGEAEGCTRLERTVRVDREIGAVYLPMSDGLVRVRRVKVDGKPEQDASTGLRPFIRM